jgi:hypothetical protein
MASNPLLKFRDEILEKVIYPKLYGILYSEKCNFSPTELWKEFREKYDCSVSLREFKEWLVSMNLEQQQVTTWNIGPPTQQVKQEPRTNQEAFDVMMDNPTLKEIEEMNYQQMKADENAVNTIPDDPTDPDISFDNE